MDNKSKERLDKVHPELKSRVSALIEALAAQNLDVRVVQGLRTFKEQDALFRKRPKVTNARGGQSNHNYGLAVDLCPFKNNQPDWDDETGFLKIGREAKKLGLEWGGDWQRLRDMPHVQLSGLSIKECFALFQKGGLNAVWRRMNDILGGEPTISFIPTKDDILEKGDRGEEIKKLQTRLFELAYLGENHIDGIFGKKTKEAVIAFQQNNGLTADGIVGDGTRAVLGI